MAKYTRMGDTDAPEQCERSRPPGRSARPAQVVPQRRPLSLHLQVHHICSAENCVLMREADKQHPAHTTRSLRAGSLGVSLHRLLRHRADVGPILDRRRRRTALVRPRSRGRCPGPLCADRRPPAPVRGWLRRHVAAHGRRRRFLRVHRCSIRGQTGNTRPTTWRS